MRSLRHRSWVVRAAIAAVVAVAAAGCTDRAPSVEGGAPGVSPRPPPAAGVGTGAVPRLDCVVDDDCVLLPDITCCDECAPAPPFEVGTIASLDALLIENEHRCAVERASCEHVPPCAIIPEGCTAHAACADGRCVVVERGCGRPVI
ncbi:MAG: hypothetical protein H6708_26595 [Kofleriaceae bacterium]|nr:hypothetical protein [Kofleriaceae bacterium]